jgi:hypothetical protein
MLVEADEADDVAERRVGLPALTGGSIHAGGCPSSFAASWPAFTSSLRANLVAVERGHDNWSITVMDCGGAMRVGEGMRGGEASGKRRRRGAHTALSRERRRQRRWVLSAEVNTHLALPLYL